MSIANEQVPGVYRRRVGDMVVTALLDGSLVLPREAFLGMAAEPQEALMRAAALRPPFPVMINTFVLQTGGKTILVDTGGAGLVGPGAGRLMANLSSAGLAAEDVDAVLITHMHTDHIGGLLSAAGAPAFPRADLHVSDAEMAFWHDDGAKAAAPEARRATFDAVRRLTTPYAERTRRFAFADTEVLPGIRAVPLPGHTPGMTGYLISSRGESLLIWADLVHNAAIQGPHPEVALVFDTDPAQGITTRRALLSRAADEDLLVTGMHLGFPGFSRVSRDGDAFRIAAEPWLLLD